MHTSHIHIIIYLGTPKVGLSPLSPLSLKKGQVDYQLFAYLVYQF